MENKVSFDVAIQEILAEILADGYKKTNLKFQGASVYIATYDKPVCISNPWFILREDDDVWLADDETTEQLAKMLKNDKIYS